MTESKKPLYKIRWLGYNPKPNYQRVWGSLIMDDGRHYAFWGVIGKRLLFKQHSEWTISALIVQQISKGYQKISIEDYEKISPGFRDDLEVWCTTAILADDLR